MRLSDVSYVNDLTPEEAMRLLRLESRRIWDDIDDKTWRNELFEKTWEGKVPALSWMLAYDVLERLERGPEPETLIELLESVGVDRNYSYQQWSKLSERQRKKVLQDIMSDLATEGFAKFLDAIAYGITLVILPMDIKERRRVLKDTENKAIQFLNGEISFDELINYIVELLSPLMRKRDFEAIAKGAALSKYLTKTELKKLVDKILVGKLDKELSKYPEPYW